MMTRYSWFLFIWKSLCFAFLIEDTFTGYKMLSWQLFSFSVLHSFWREIIHHSNLYSSIHNVSFSLGSFSDFFLYFLADWFSCIWAWPLVNSCFGFNKLLKSIIYTKDISAIFHQIFFYINLFLLFFWDSNDTNFVSSFHSSETQLMFSPWSFSSFVFRLYNF